MGSMVVEEHPCGKVLLQLEDGWSDDWRGQNLYLGYRKDFHVFTNSLINLDQKTHRLPVQVRCMKNTQHIAIGENHCLKHQRAPPWRQRWLWRGVSANGPSPGRLFWCGAHAHTCGIRSSEHSDTPPMCTTPDVRRPRPTSGSGWPDTRRNTSTARVMSKN